ncbi:oligosaccharide flippase family protein [Pseudomonas sp. TNT3]|uniref:lipopolysaccharide biosynthesis protein n=1 Tax=Pseudomonas sp. TNT3 TaxID=2654097 RepID=UPI00139091CA|nr:oligosaccharide flippase family protein [Pseudomonas sp. TNT3]KAI2689527.1 oligosaccharide flippase family protein [Pseudomonas sp. TNT3]
MSLKKKDTAISLGSIIIGQAAFFICLSLIGRTWGAEELGKLNLNLSLGMFIGTIMAFRYELSCIQEKEEKSYQALIQVVIITTTTLVFLYVIGSTWKLTNSTITLIFSTTFILQQSCSLYLNTLRKYALIGLIKISANVSFAISLIILINLSTISDTFLIYTAINLIVTAICLILIIKKSQHPNLFLNFEFYKENLKFPRYTLPATLLSSTLTYSLPIVIPFFYGPIVAGYFAATQRFGFFPVSLIAQSISGIFRREIISAINSDDGKLLDIYISHGKLLLAISMCYLFFGNLFFGLLIDILLGDSWKQATTFFHIISPLYAVQIIYIPLSQVFLSTNNQRLDLYIQILIFTSTAATFAASYIFDLSSTLTVSIFSASGVVVLLIGLKLTHSIIKKISVKPYDNIILQKHN